jgi:hypothetical protein
MGLAMHAALFAVLAAAVLPAPGQVIEFESNGLKYQTLTRNGLTVMSAVLPAQVRDFNVLQVAISNGSKQPYTLRPENFLFIRGDGSQIVASSARAVVDSLLERASRSDVIKLITTYENSIYGNIFYKGTNGYEARRQSALAEFTSTRLRAAAAASAIAFVPVKLAPGQSTDGAVFYPSAGKPLGSGTVRVQAAGAVFEFPLVSLQQTP